MYKNLDDIKKRFIELGIKDTLGVKKEMKELPNILKENEEILYAISGAINGNTNLIVCTDTRVILIDKGLIYGIKSSEMPISNITHISYKKGLVFGEIYIQSLGGTTLTIKNSMKEYTEPMVKIIEKQMENNNYIKKDNYDNIDVAEEIRKFKNLLDDGIITEEEFNIKKSELLKL